MTLTNLSATSIALAEGSKTQSTAPVIDLARQDSGSLARQGADLIIRLPNGVTEVHANFFTDPDAVFSQPGSLAVSPAEMLVAAFNLLQPAVVLAQANSGKPGNPTLSDAGESATEIDGAAVSQIAQVAETDGAVRRVRERASEVVKSGDEVLDGDLLTNGSESTIQLVFTRSLSRDDGDMPITGSMGPTSRVQFLAGEGADGLLTARLTLFSGALEITNLPDNGEQFYISTPAGVVVARGQSVSVSVNPRNGETTVVALGVPNLSIDGVGVYLQQQGAESRIDPSGVGVTLGPGGAGGGVGASSFGRPDISASGSMASLDEHGAIPTAVSPSGSASIPNAAPYSGGGTSAPFSALTAGASFSSASTSTRKI